MKYKELLAPANSLKRLGQPRLSQDSQTAMIVGTAELELYYNFSEST